MQPITGKAAVHRVLHAGGSGRAAGGVSPAERTRRIRKKVNIMAQRKYQYIYGPVPSRRLGLSLGVDLVPFKTCSYNCIYCQLGRTKTTTVERKEYIPGEGVTDEIEAWLEEGAAADYITMSGSGEPTLNSKIGDIIRKTKKMTDIPVAVITNGSLLSRQEVREGLAQADLVVPSLDAGSPGLFRYINRPDPAVEYKDMVSGLVDFSEMFKGDIWVEVFLVYPANTFEKDLKELKMILDRIKCDKIHLNTCARPPAESYADKTPREKIQLALDIIGEKAEAVIPFDREMQDKTKSLISEAMIVNLLERRPCSLEDIASSFQTSPNEVLKYLTPLIDNGKVSIEDQETQRFYKAG